MAVKRLKWGDNGTIRHGGVSVAVRLDGRSDETVPTGSYPTVCDAMYDGTLSYDQFWLQYLRAHTRPSTRLLHYGGSLLAILCLALAVLRREWLWLPAALIIGHGFAWGGHSAIEGNRPQTFGHPFWSLASDGTNGTPDTTNGIEQPQWSPQTGLFYVSLPQVGPNVANGGVSVIDPHTLKVVATFPVQNCTPGGLTLGPRHQALIGCSGSFGTSPNIVTQSLVIDIKTGNVAATIPAGGNDEVWYDRGSNHYYVTAATAINDCGAMHAGVSILASNRSVRKWRQSNE